MFGKVLRKEEVTTALVLTLSGAIMVRVANGPGRLSLRRIVAAALSNPVPRRGVPGARELRTLPAEASRSAAA
jgi:hypothetical protein